MSLTESINVNKKTLTINVSLAIKTLTSIVNAEQENFVFK